MCAILVAGGTINPRRGQKLAVANVGNREEETVAEQSKRVAQGHIDSRKARERTPKNAKRTNHVCLPAIVQPSRLGMGLSAILSRRSLSATTALSSLGDRGSQISPASNAPSHRIFLPPNLSVIPPVFSTIFLPPSFCQISPLSGSIDHRDPAIPVVTLELLTF